MTTLFSIFALRGRSNDNYEQRMELIGVGMPAR